ncbi:MAG: hypothetical protein Q4C60_07790 [Eubacteriales bacterium]|nr:hypothetical protein [Eubacteriales bacterium]
MADISKEIENFRSARYGREVRGSMISLAEKLNQEVEAGGDKIDEQVEIILQTKEQSDAAVETAKTAVQRANESIDHADQILTQATEQADRARDEADASEGSATLSRSWAIGATGTRDGENTNNSMYFAGRSQAQADRAQQEADRASQYSQIVAPGFYFEPETAMLYMKAGAGVDFTIADATLYWKVVA